MVTSCTSASTCSTQRRLGEDLNTEITLSCFRLRDLRSQPTTLRVLPVKVRPRELAVSPRRYTRHLFVEVDSEGESSSVKLLPMKGGPADGPQHKANFAASLHSRASIGVHGVADGEPLWGRRRLERVPFEDLLGKTRRSEFQRGRGKHARRERTVPRASWTLVILLPQRGAPCLYSMPRSFSGSCDSS